MTSFKRYISQNLFTLFLSTIIAITAGFYSCLFQEPKTWEIATWVIIAFLVLFITTSIAANFLQKIIPIRKRIFSYSLYSIATLAACNLFIFPATFLLTGSTTEDNKHSICCETPLEYGATEYQIEKFTLADGVTISGWYIPSSTQKGSLIILIHGHYNDRRGTSEWAKILIKAGYGIYMYDQRGNGESEGVLDYLHTNFSADLLDIRKQLATKYSIKRFGAVGLSMGAHTLINAFSQDKSAFQAVWLDGLWPQAVKDLDVFCPEVLMYSNLDMVTQIIVTNPPPKVEPLLDILSQNDGTKIMVVAAGAEDMETSTGRKLASAKSNTVDNWIIPKSLHLTGIYDASDEYQKKLLRFFKALEE